jgi:segregation and condensation protein B
MWNKTNHFPRTTLRSNASGTLPVGDVPQPQREKLRWSDSSIRIRHSPLAQLQILPDGGLVRSTRIARMEAALLIAEGAIPARKLAQVARLIDAKEVQQLIHVLNESYDRTRSAFRIEQTAAGYTLMTRASISPWLDRLHNRQAEMKLSNPMMETLTIIAYQQPVTRADVEAIRGVQATDMIRQLMDRGLVRIGGEDDSLGRPFLYVTTKQFLTMFGLYRLEDLPNYSTLRRQRTLPAIAETGDDDEDDQEIDEAA